MTFYYDRNILTFYIEKLNYLIEIIVCIQIHFTTKNIEWVFIICEGNSILNKNFECKSANVTFLPSIGTVNYQKVDVNHSKGVSLFAVDLRSAKIINSYFSKNRTIHLEIDIEKVLSCFPTFGISLQRNGC